MSPSELFTLPNEVLAMVSADLRDRGDQASLRRLYMTSKLLRNIVTNDLDHAVYVVYEKSGSDGPFDRGLSDRRREERKFPPPELYDSDTRGVAIKKRPFPSLLDSLMGNTDGGGDGPLLRLLECLDCAKVEESETMRENTRKLVIKSKHENVSKVSYSISPDLLGKVLEKLPKLETLSVGQIGVRCPKDVALNYLSKFRLKTLEARWDPLEFCSRNAFCPDMRCDRTSFSEILAMFSHIEDLRLVYFMEFWSRHALARCEAHGLTTVRAVHLVPPRPVPRAASRILLFLRQSIDLSALEKLVVDDECHVLSQDINNLLFRTAELSTLALSFKHPPERRNIQPGIVDLSKLKMLRDLTLDILVRPNPEPQPEWEKAVGTLRSAAHTPVTSIVLRFATRLVPPEEETERQAWYDRSPAERAEGFQNATWPPCAWDTLREVLQKGFRKLQSLQIEYCGPVDWAEAERLRAQSTFGYRLTKFAILEPDSSSL